MVDAANDSPGGGSEEGETDWGGDGDDGRGGGVWGDSVSRKSRREGSRSRRGSVLGLELGLDFLVSPPESQPMVRLTKGSYIIDNDDRSISLVRNLKRRTTRVILRDDGVGLSLNDTKRPLA